ncbi:penicillin-binding protein [Sphingobacterium alkalisoli]|uniref:Penicillin-binding protein n=1 Tax=Sphingobacterium alkalisoli TaxID=1874115 RepID=A0A4U0H874_9SPHI|nr:biosynthetic peptidoglycan transglycosylase [Sphingobacterium alkalisoli]TJY68073.1 penicillin-binding protein [Sphingobacterium alkalisoli]GGH09240.1 glycosyl transferase [Sphingobacterium alkalisoli]
MFDKYLPRINANQKKWIGISVVFLFVVVVVGMAIGLSKRDAYLRQAIGQVQHKLRDAYKVDVQIRKYQFEGLNTVLLEDVIVLPEDRDTLSTIQKLRVSIRLLPLLFGNIKIGDLDLYDGKVSFVKKDSVSNYDFLFRKKERDTTVIEEPTERNFAEFVEKIAKQVFSKVPNDMHVVNFEVSYKDEDTSQKIRIPEAIIDNGDFETSMFLNEHDAEWILEGHVDGDAQQLSVAISAKDKDTEIPFLKSKYGLKVSFDKLVFDLNRIKKESKNLLLIEGGWEYVNLVVNHHRLSDQDIILPHGIAEGGIQVANDHIALSKDARVTVDNFTINPILKYTLKPKRKLDLAIHTGQFKAQHFFDALPNGLFESLDGVEVAGDVKYDLDFSVVLDDPDNLVFKSSIDDTDLRVVKWGKADVKGLNSSFVYEAFDDTTLLRTFVVGTENPKFVSLNNISDILKTTVRNTEDPFFYKHNGFEEEAFKLSIATNIKEKRFKRGASTISMQLVKNVFLNRKKTMNRKLEEILLVWLMESSGQVTKDRLYEIYLNVIEWGKNVYGISEAANYYFLKHPADLNIGESLFLSSIIPRPKTGLSSFDHTGHLKPWVQRHFNTYGYIMNKMGELKNITVPANYGFYEVVLQPQLRPAAPVMRDTTTFDFDVNEEHEQIMRDIEMEEKAKKSILDKLFDK